MQDCLFIMIVNGSRIEPDDSEQCSGDWENRHECYGYRCSKILCVHLILLFGYYLSLLYNFK